MNRQARRQQDIQYKKSIKTIGKFTPEQIKIIDIASRERGSILADNCIENFEKLLDRCLTAALIDYGISYEDIDAIQENMSELMEEDNMKSEKLEKENVNMEKIQDEVQAALEILLKDGTTKKEIVNRLMFKFPKLSKSMILNAYAKVKRELEPIESKVSLVFKYFEENSNKLNGKQMIAHAMNKFKLAEGNTTAYYYRWKKQFMGSNKVVPNVTEKVSEADQKNADKIIEKIKERQCVKPIVKTPIINILEEEKMNDLKIIEEKVVKTIKAEGVNGAYEANTEKGIILNKGNSTICFQNEEDFDAWVIEFKQVFKMIV
jgi:hypothetical protein